MLNVNDIVQSGGLLLIGAFLFAEVGIFLGFFLPGDTLLIAAGIYASQGKLSVVAVIIVAAIAATAGDSTAYGIGRKLGPRIFRNQDSVIFRPEHVARAEAFYEKYGPKTLLVAHFLPVIRTLSPLLAGVGKMHYPRFLAFDATGDTAWAIIVTLVGYYVGSRIPNVDHYILVGLACIILLTAAPTLFQIGRLTWKHRRNTRSKDQVATSVHKTSEQPKSSN
jgi:membrane-associated protein